MTRLPEKAGVFLLELVLAPSPPRKRDLDPKHRQLLLAQGLIELEPHGRTELIVPTDAAWDRVAANLDMRLTRVQTRRALAAVLARLRDFLASRELAFADFVQPLPRTPRQELEQQPREPPRTPVRPRTQPSPRQRSLRKSPPRNPPQPRKPHNQPQPRNPPQSRRSPQPRKPHNQPQPRKPPQPRHKPPPLRKPPQQRDRPPLELRIRDAYVAHTNGKFHTRMRLTALRAMLADTEREMLDAALRQLSARGALALFPLDDRTEISAADARDALDLSGVPQHVMYLEG